MPLGSIVMFKVDPESSSPGLPTPCVAWCCWVCVPVVCPLGEDMCTCGGEEVAACAWTASAPGAQHCTIWVPACSLASQARFFTLRAELAGSKGRHAFHAKDTMLTHWNRPVLWVPTHSLLSRGSPLAGIHLLPRWQVRWLFVNCVY